MEVEGEEEGDIYMHKCISVRGGGYASHAGKALLHPAIDK